MAQHNNDKAGWVLPVLALANIITSPPLFATEEEDITLIDETFISIVTGEKQQLADAPAAATVFTAKDINAMGAQSLNYI